MKTMKIYGTDEVIYTDKCDNGLEIYLYVNEKVKNFYATLNVKYGSVDTEFRVDGKEEIIKVPHGIAHFLEHLKFNLPGNKSASEFFGKLGSSINAFTSHNITAYEVFASCYFKENVEHLLDYVQTNHFTKTLVEREKGIIIEEIRMYEDTPGAVLYNKMNECLYLKDNRRFMISGTIQDVKKTSLEDMHNVYEAFYHPENMFIVITGNFNPEEAISLIKENQNKKEFPKYQNPVVVREEEPIAVAQEYLEINLNIEMPKIQIAFKMDRNDFKVNDLELRIYLNAFLQSTFGVTSDLREELLKNGLITGDVVTSVTLKNNYVVLTVMAETTYPTELIKVIKREIQQAKINQATIERKKKVAIANTILKYDDIEAVNGEIQDDLIIYQKLITDYIKTVKKISYETAKKIKTQMNFDNYAVVTMYPLKENK